LNIFEKTLEAYEKRGIEIISVNTALTLLEDLNMNYTIPDLLSLAPGRSITPESNHSADFSRLDKETSQFLGANS
jgi:hypothetical protein